MGRQSWEETQGEQEDCESVTRRAGKGAVVTPFGALTVGGQAFSTPWHFTQLVLSPSLHSVLV